MSNTDKKQEKIVLTEWKEITQWKEITEPEFIARGSYPSNMEELMYITENGKFPV